MGEVHSQVVDGPGTRWKGIHTYYDEIVKTVAEIKDKVIAEEAVIKTTQRMSTHVGNLKRKQKAFTTAYNKPTLKRGIRVVRGTVGEERVMKYTEEVMSVKAFKAAQEGLKAAQELGVDTAIKLFNTRKADAEVNIKALSSIRIKIDNLSNLI